MTRFILPGLRPVRRRFGFAATPKDSIGKDLRWREPTAFDQIDGSTGSKKVRKILDTTVGTRTRRLVCERLDGQPRASCYARAARSACRSVVTHCKVGCVHEGPSSSDAYCRTACSPTPFFCRSSRAGCRPAQDWLHHRLIGLFSRMF